MKRISNIIVVLLISLIVSNTASLYELAKTPFLIQHFFEHHSRHPKDSFMDFLYKHYVQHQPAESEADRKSDMQLPYKSSHFFHTDLPPFILEEEDYAVIVDYLAVCSVRYSAPEINSHTLNTWHPPRIG